MERNTLTVEETNARFLIVRSDLLEIFDWNPQLAKVCQIFVKQDDRIYNRMLQKGEDGDRWFSMSTKEIYKWGLREVGTTNIDLSIKELESRGVISVTRAKSVCGIRRFRLNTKVLNQMLSDVFGLNIKTPDPTKCPNRRRVHHDIEPPSSDDLFLPQNCESGSTNLLNRGDFFLPQNCGGRNNTIGTRIEETGEKEAAPPPSSLAPEKETTTVASTCNATIPTEAPRYPEKFSSADAAGVETECQPLPSCGLNEKEEPSQGIDELQVLSNPEVTSGFEQSPTPPLIPSPSPFHSQPAKSFPCVTGDHTEIEAGDDRMDYRWFTGSYLRNCRRAKKPTGQVKQRVMDFLERTQLSGSYIERCLEQFGQSEWAQENGYPLLAFVKNPAKWDNDPDAAHTEAQARFRGTRTTRSTPQFAGEPVNAKSWDAATAWNEKVKVAPAVALSIRNRAWYSRVTSDVEFRERFDEIVDKAEQFHAQCGGEVEWLKLTWLMDTKDGELEPNWKRFVSGKLDFLLERASRKSITSVQQVADESLARVLAQFQIAS